MTTLDIPLAPQPVPSISYQGRDFPTADMTIFPTGQPCLPFVYLTRGGIFFLQTHRAQWETPRVRRIPRHEAHRIANLYRVESLTHVLSHPVPELISPPLPPSTDAELIRQINQLTPDQLDKLAGILQSNALQK